MRRCADCSNPNDVARRELVALGTAATVASGRTTVAPLGATTAVKTGAMTDAPSVAVIAPRCPVMIGVVPLVTSDGRCETRSVGSEGTESSEPSESSEPAEPSESAGGSAAYLAGKLLVATPAVEGDAFRRSVILMLHHDGEGAQGVVLNQPSEAAVDAVLPGWQAVATAPQTLFRGGPVGTDSAIGIVSVPGEGGKTLGVQRLFGGIGVVDLDAPPLLVAPEVAGLRIFAGYAGWSGGQLEGEIRRGDWYVVDAEPRDAFSDEPQELWESVLRRQRGNLAFVALYPDDPSMN